MQHPAWKQCDAAYCSGTYEFDRMTLGQAGEKSTHEARRAYAELIVSEKSPLLLEDGSPMTRFESVTRRLRTGLGRDTTNRACSRKRRVSSTAFTTTIQSECYLFEREMGHTNQHGKDDILLGLRVFTDQTRPRTDRF